MAINSNTSSGTEHDVEIIEIFGESTWDYPVNRYVDPNDDPSPQNSLADRLYNNRDFETHVQRMDDAVTAYHGSGAPFLAEPYVVVERPRKKILYLDSGQTQVTFEISPYGPSSSVTYAWYVNGEDQNNDNAPLSYAFIF